MSNFTYLMDSQNEVVKKAETLSVSATDTADSLLAASNAAILPISLPWRSAGVGSKSLEIDFGTAVSVDFAAAVGHNVSASATEFRFFGDSVSPAVTDIINLLPNHLGPGTTYGIRAAGSVSNQFWRLVIDDASNADGFYEVGYVVLGVSVDLGFSMNADWGESMIRSNRRAESQGGSPFVGELVDRRSRLSLVFGNLLKTERDTLKQFINGLNGARNPLFIVPDPDDNLGMFGRLETPLEIGMVHRNKGVIDETQLVFIEDNPGIRINV